MAGVSLFWSNTGWGGERFYNAQLVRWLKQEWDLKLIRAPMGYEGGGGYADDPETNKKRVMTIVDAALQEDLYVIIDWHSHIAHKHQDEAIAFFKEMATRYGEHPNVIYEIFNEPLDARQTDPVQANAAGVWKNTIKPYAEAVIAEIRKIDPDNLIIVGTPTWSQDVDVAVDDPILNQTNIAYSLHFYAGTHGQYLRNKAAYALNKGYALFVAEWGSVNANGDGAVAKQETDLWLDFFREHSLSHAYWSLNDKPEGASILKPGRSATGNWSDDDFTPSGLLARDAIKYW